jgi:ABC-2 type transport system ATP-binding protein
MTDGNDRLTAVPRMELHDGQRYAVETAGLTKRYRRATALSDCTVSVPQGRISALVGPNGAGKSTLLALLAGALPPSGGAVATALPPAAIGWAPQRPAQYRRLSARENLELFARLLGLGSAGADAAAMLAEFELPDDDRPSAHLSVGNQQRLNLAIAFLGAPRMLLLDEPTASLDPEHAAALWERIRRARDAGAGAVVATHFLDETIEADRVLTLTEGRLA